MAETGVLLGTAILLCWEGESAWSVCWVTLLNQYILWHIEHQRKYEDINQKFL